MLNQAAIDALCSAAYLENYLDCVDDLPNDLQRTVTTLRDLDCITNGILHFLIFLIQTAFCRCRVHLHTKMLNCFIRKIKRIGYCDRPVY